MLASTPRVRQTNRIILSEKKCSHMGTQLPEEVECHLSNEISYAKTKNNKRHSPNVKVRKHLQVFNRFWNGFDAVVIQV